ncbi:hypothetical protein ACCS53_39000, partial [Rhizobium ruizarguesonis]
SMRSLVSNIVTDDHVVYAELGCVRSLSIFSQYVARNSMLPQVTGLALSLDQGFGASGLDFRPTTCSGCSTSSDPRPNRDC